MIQKENLAHLKAFQQEEISYRYHVAQALKQLKERFYDLDERPNLEALKEKILSKIHTDHELVSTLKHILRSHSSLQNIPKPLRYNQLPRITRNTYKLIENHFEALIDDRDPIIQGYDYTYDSYHITWLGDPDPNAFYGTSRVTPLKDAYLRLTLMQKKHHYLDELDDILCKWPEHTVLVSPHPFSHTLFQKHPDFENCTYFSQNYSIANRRHSIIIPHNYYELGGGHTGYDNTQDCSALIARYTTDSLFTTLALHIHSLLAYKGILSEKYFDYSYLEPISSSRMMRSIAHHLIPAHFIDTSQPIHIRDPQIDIKPGMVMCTRDIEINNSDLSQQTLGVKGHTAFAISEPKADGQLWTGGCERRLSKNEVSKNKDGIGYAPTQIMSQPSADIRRVTHFFKPKQNRQRQHHSWDTRPPPYFHTR